jgi:hypothetical protein
MRDDMRLLSELNVEICDAKDRGDKEWLAAVVAPHFAFRKANGEIEGREEFLASIRAGGRRETEVESIEIYGDRAIATCMVKSGGQRYHNLRMFVRREDEWKLVAWANEVVQ